MKELGIFFTLLITSLFLVSIGPFFMLAPIFGLPLVFIHNILFILLNEKANKYILSLIITVILMFITYVVADILAVGMLFQSFGILLMTFITPLLYTKLKEAK